MENVRHNSDPKGNLFLSDFPEKLFSTGWVPAFDRRVLDAIGKLKNSIFKIYTSVFFENGQHNFSYLNLGCVSDVALTDHGTVIVGIVPLIVLAVCDQIVIDRKHDLSLRVADLSSIGGPTPSSFAQQRPWPGSVSRSSRSSFSAVSSPIVAG